MALTLITWQQVAERKLLKSNSFKALDTAVKNYIAHGNGHLGALQTAWNNWKVTLGNKNGHKTYQTSDRYQPGCALDDIEQMFQIPANPGFPAIRSQAELLRQRDALSDERSGDFVKVNGKWQQKIFTQQETESCTCACATTFMSKLMGKTLKEEVFKNEFDRQLGSHHDFSSTGTLFPGIERTLLACGADVEHQTTSNKAALLAKLKTATRDVPILFGVSWTSGGAHAVMCVGEGPVKFSNLTYPFQGLIVEDPFPDHEEAGMKANGHYWARLQSSGAWIEGWADPKFGVIIGKPSRSQDRGQYIDYRKGIRVM